MRPHLGRWAVAAAVAVGLAGSVWAGAIDLAWDPAADATGYRIHYGTTSGDYTQSVNVGNNTQATLGNLADCTTYYVVVRAYNPAGEGTDSNEISGWARPSIVQSTTPAMQGSQVVLDINGANFDLGATVTVDTASVPLDTGGSPLLTLDSVAVLDCDHIQALVTIEPMAYTFQPMPLGNLSLGLEVVNPDDVYNTGSVTLDVQFNESRADINRLHERTMDRVNGDDLASLARAWGSSVGDTAFEFDCDMDGDTNIDGNDLAWLATVFGECLSGGIWSSGNCF